MFKRLIIAASIAAALISSANAQTGSTKTATQLNAEINYLFPDNLAGLDTPFAARQTLLDIVASSTTGAIGGCNPATPPTQTTPVFSIISECGSYADSTSGAIFQISSWADNTGTRPTVPIFGQGRALGTNSRAWGSNFVCYSGATGAFCQGSEIDFGVQAGIASQSATGISINVGGGATGANLNVGIAFDQLASNTTMTSAIRFNNFAGGQPYTTALLEAPGPTALTVPYGLKFDVANFGTAAIQTKGFAVNPNGQIASGTNGGTGGQLTLNGATSGSGVINVSATGGLLQIGSASFTADNTGTLTAVNLTAQNLKATALLILNNATWVSNTAPTIASGFCTTPTIPTNNGVGAFTINVGTACAASTGTLTMPAAATAWVCQFHDVTTPASNIVEQTGGTTTTVTLTNYVRTTGVAGNFTSSDVIRGACVGY